MRSTRNRTENTQPADMLEYIRGNGGAVYQPTGNTGRPIAARWFEDQGRSESFCENVEKASTWRTHPGVLKSAGYLVEENGWWRVTNKPWIGLPKPVDSLKRIMELLRPLMTKENASKVDDFLLLRSQQLQNSQQTEEEFLGLQHPTAFGQRLETYGDGGRTCLFHPLDKSLLPEGTFTYADVFILPYELNYAYSNVRQDAPKEYP